MTKKPATKKKAAAKPTEAELARSYSDVVRQIKAQNPDWTVERLNVDADIRTNAPELLQYSRDLWRENPYVIAYGNELKTNVHGPFGIRYRSMIKETEDRVVSSAEEKAFLRNYEGRRERINDWLKKKGREPILHQRIYSETSRKMVIKAGAPDVFANQYFERAFTEWQQKEHCTVTGRLTYNQSRILRLRACARDGEHFIRLVRNTTKGWKFGFKIQHINAEWCDRCLCVAESAGWEDADGNLQGKGNPIRNGIEYDAGTGLEPVAYWFIKQDAATWMNVNAVRGQGKKSYVRIPANEIIHYAMFEDDADVSRPVPWVVGVMNSSRHLSKFMEAAVVAARVGACSNVFFQSAVDGPDGMGAATADPRDVAKTIQQMTPGGAFGLPPGVTANITKPNYPNQDVGGFRNEAVREVCAGLPGASHAVIAQNYAEINFSAGKLDRLTSTGAWMMLQEMDIENAERIIHREWQKMALQVQAVKLPIAKFEKFNKAHFQGRRWPGVDAVKEVTAAAAAVANKFTTRTAVIESGICGEAADFEETLFKLAEEEMMIESFGMNPMTTAESPAPAPVTEEEDEEETEEKNPKAA